MKNTSPIIVLQERETPRGCIAFNKVTCDEYAIYSPLLFSRSHAPQTSYLSDLL